MTTDCPIYAAANIYAAIHERAPNGFGRRHPPEGTTLSVGEEVKSVR